MTKLIGDHDIVCGGPSCASRGATSAKVDLAAGWGYRLALRDDDVEDHVVPYCPICAELDLRRQVLGAGARSGRPFHVAVRYG